jgi:putative component of toxin-antitoxin plasmid stabilization module
VDNIRRIPVKVPQNANAVEKVSRVSRLRLGEEANVRAWKKGIIEKRCEPIPDEKGEIVILCQCGG